MQDEHEDPVDYEEFGEFDDESNGKASRRKKQYIPLRRMKKHGGRPQSKIRRERERRQKRAIAEREKA